MGSCCTKSAGVQDGTANMAAPPQSKLQLTAVGPEQGQQDDQMTAPVPVPAPTLAPAAAPDSTDKGVILVAARPSAPAPEPESNVTEQRPTTGNPVDITADATIDDASARLTPVTPLAPVEQQSPIFAVSLCLEGEPLTPLAVSTPLRLHPAPSHSDERISPRSAESSRTPRRHTHNAAQADTASPIVKKLSLRRASGSQKLSTEVSGRLHGGGGQADGQTSRKVSRPSTPISRTDQRAMLVSSPLPLSPLVSPSAAMAAAALTISDPLGWGQAPNSAAAAAAFELGATTTHSPHHAATALAALAPGLGVRGGSGDRSARRRTEQPYAIRDAIPETIQERLAKHSRAAQDDPLASTTAPGGKSASNNRRASGGPLVERSWHSSSRATLLDHLIRDEMRPCVTGGGDGEHGSGDPASHSHSHLHSGEGGHSFTGGGGGGGGGGGSGGAASRVRRNSNPRYELTDAQLRDLQAKPYLWTDPLVFGQHVEEMFSYYSTLPLPAAASSAAPSPRVAAGASGLEAPVPAATESSASASLLPSLGVAPASTSTSTSATTSTSSLPSIHHADRIVWSQLQQLARDGIARLHVLVRNSLRKSRASQALEALSPEAEEKAVWAQLEQILPGHGHPAHTHGWVALFLLSALARSRPGSVGRREFTLLWPEAHQQLLCDPAAVVPRDRKKLIQFCYTLKLEELLNPPVGAAFSSGGGGGGGSGAEKALPPAAAAAAAFHAAHPNGPPPAEESVLHRHMSQRRLSSQRTATAHESLSPTHAHRENRDRDSKPHHHHHSSRRNSRGSRSSSPSPSPRHGRRDRSRERDILKQ